MLGCETGAARVGGVVDQDGLSAVSDLAAQVSQVDLPAFLGEQVVCVEFHTEVLADGLTEREARLGDKDAVTDFTHDCHRVVQSARASKGKEHVVWVNRVLLRAELVSDGLASWGGARRLRVAVLGLRLNDLDDRLIDDWRKLKAIGS